MTSTVKIDSSGWVTDRVTRRDLGRVQEDSATEEVRPGVVEERYGGWARRGRKPRKRCSGNQGGAVRIETITHRVRQSTAQRDALKAMTA